MATEKRERTTTATVQATLDSLGQLREILFGAIQRDLERRLGRIDAPPTAAGRAVATRTARAHDREQESRRRTEVVVEAHLRKETEALIARFERESADRS